MSRFARIQSKDEKAVDGIGDNYKLGHHDDVDYEFKSKKGLTEAVVLDISKRKNEPEWMLEIRLKALERYYQMKIPKWGGDIEQIDFENIHYYLQPKGKQERSWEDVPDAIKKTFEKIGVPEAEKGMLAGVKAQYDSEVIYGSLRKNLEDRGVIFLGMDEGLKRYPDLVKEYFGKIIPMGDNKLAALNTAVWSGGSFLYIPKGVEVGMPLQTYFRINSENAGQFERTLIIADEGSKVHYVEGCSAPAYSSGSLHAAVVEVFVKKGAKVTYTTVQNWYKNVYNLVTKRAHVGEDAEMRWIDGNLGCVVGDTQISTPTGYKQISEIQEGDGVYTLDMSTMSLTASRVVAWKEMGIKMTYELITEDGRKILATDNHPFLMLRKRSGYEIYEINWEPLANLKSGDLIGVLTALPDEGESKKIEFSLESKRLINVPIIANRTDENLMWLLGAYIGDGCLDGEGRVDFAIPENDKAHQKICEILQGYGLRWTQKKVTKRISSTYFVKLLKYLGFGGNAKTKRIPEWVFGLPIKEKLAFIEGYMFTDGCIRKKKEVGGRLYGQIVFASANVKLLEQFRLLMYTCGLEPRNISRYIKERKLYKGAIKEYESYYLSMNLDKNYEIIVGRRSVGSRIRFVKIKTITRKNNQHVYDIEVESGHSFVGNGIVVHNSRLTMKYPCCVLAGRRARGETLSIAFAGEGQHQDTGAKMIHLAPGTTSQIISKSISKGGGRASYRGKIQINKGATGAKSKVVCDALILDTDSRSDTYPTNLIMESSATLEHEATVSKVGEEQLFYLMSRGLPEHEAEAMIVNGFLEPIMKQIPLEYAVEMNRLVELEMEGSVG